jgi:hypothetical protein
MGLKTRGVHSQMIIKHWKLEIRASNKRIPIFNWNPVIESSSWHLKTGDIFPRANKVCPLSISRWKSRFTLSVLILQFIICPDAALTFHCTSRRTHDDKRLKRGKTVGTRLSNTSQTVVWKPSQSFEEAIPYLGHGNSSDDKNVTVIRRNSWIALALPPKWRFGCLMIIRFRCSSR